MFAAARASRAPMRHLRAAQWHQVRRLQTSQQASAEDRRSATQFERTILPLLQRYRQTHGHAHPPFEYCVTAADASAAGAALPPKTAGFALGRSLRMLQTKQTHLVEKPERAAALRELGATVDHWMEVIVPALKWHREEFGHVRVGQTLEMTAPELADAGLPLQLAPFRLGRAVNMMRTRRQGRHHAEFCAAIDELGFVWDEHERRWREEVLPAIKFYADTRGNVNVPQAYVMGQADCARAGMPADRDSYNLGQLCANIRWHGQYWSRNPERVPVLEELGFVLNPVEEGNEGAAEQHERQ